MALRFRGGESLQRGRGIGGLLRLAKGLFTPILKKAGKAVISAAKSSTGRAAIDALKQQAVESGANLAADLIQGNDMKTSLQNEANIVRNKASDGLRMVGSQFSVKKRPAKRKAQPPKKKPKSKKRRDIFG